ncbi:hypothetical protein GOV04_05020 [Candidatus Woesearchaeota archaeon]|nr:hypothetical protein [Candidatus Woesearchaeota archaeon]
MERQKSYCKCVHMDYCNFCKIKISEESITKGYCVACGEVPYIITGEKCPVCFDVSYLNQITKEIAGCRCERDIGNEITDVEIRRKAYKKFEEEDARYILKCLKLDEKEIKQRLENLKKVQVEREKTKEEYIGFIFGLSKVAIESYDKAKETLENEHLVELTSSEVINEMALRTTFSQNNPLNKIMPQLEIIIERNKWSWEQFSRKIINWFDDWGDLEETLRKKAFD